MDAEFELRATRDDFLHAFVAFFDVQFTQCHKVLTIATGPRSRHTHWKQTIFYLDEPMAIHKARRGAGSKG